MVVQLEYHFNRQQDGREAMKYTTSAIILGLALTVTAQEDTFNYDSTSGKSYGPQDWDKVGCNNLATCVSSHDR